MWRRTVIWSLGVALVAGAAEADAQVFLGFVDSSKRFAVRDAVEGAVRPCLQTLQTNQAAIF
jgi:hypothetical protein